MSEHFSLDPPEFSKLLAAAGQARAQESVSWAWDWQALASRLKSELRAQLMAWSSVMSLPPPSAAELCHTSLAQSPGRGFGWGARVMSAGLKLCSPLFISVPLRPFLGPNTSLLGTAEPFPGLSHQKVARQVQAVCVCVRGENVMGVGVRECVCECGRGL